MKKIISIILIITVFFSVNVLAVNEQPADRELPADTGYVDYSTEKTAIFFNTTGDHNRTVFVDFYYPFDSTLKLNHYDALIKYDMADELAVGNGGVYVSLDELSRLYAPYFTYGIQDGQVHVRHIQFTKTVTEGAGTRTPKLDYVKTIWDAEFDLEGKNITASKTIYEAYNTTAANGVVEAMEHRSKRRSHWKLRHLPHVLWMGRFLSLWRI